MASRGTWGTKKQLDLQDKALREALLEKIGKNRWTYERMAMELGMSLSTFRRRLEKPREFTLCELRRVMGVLGWGRYDIYDNLFGNWEVS